MKLAAVMICSFAIGWFLYRCTHDDQMLKEDYTQEEMELEKQREAKDEEKRRDLEEAKKEGYKKVTD